MAKKKGGLHQLMHFVAWLTGVIVSLSVGFALKDGPLGLPSYLGGELVSVAAGWIVLLTTAIGVVLVVIDYFK